MPSDPTAIQRFVAEAREHLAGMTAAVMELERCEGQPQAVVDRVLRAAHSIKGGAGFTGLRNIERLAHALEEALENIRDGRVASSSDVVDTLLAVLDRLLALVDDAAHADEADLSGVLARLRPLAEAGTTEDRIVPAAVGTAAGAEPVAVRHPAGLGPAAEFSLSPAVLSRWQPGGSRLYGVRLDWCECERDLAVGPHEVAERVARCGDVLDSRTEVAGPPLSDGPPAPPLWWLAVVSSALDPEQFEERLGIPSAAVVVLRERSAAAGPAPAARREHTGAGTGAGPGARAGAAAGPASSLRIPVRLIDRLVELAGELSLVRNQALRATDPSDVALRRLTRRLDSVTNELQGAALRMRMQPVGTLFDRFPRLVRDLARQLGRRIELEVTGSEVALDKAILEMLADPLTHLIRNSCDHGIEPPEQREAAGKPPAGRISLSARPERGQIVIEVRDDGRGIDREAVKRKAVKQGIRRGDELDRLTDRQVFDLILLSGFSTADRVTDLSGRGVGMDVVKTNLDQVGGVVEIDSAPGAGTVFSLRLPLTLAIVPCLLVVGGGQRYALPQRDVDEILLVDAPGGRLRIECSQDEELLRLRGELLPVVRLAEVLGRRQPMDDGARAGVVRRYHGAGAERRETYAAVVRVGSHRFALAFDRVVDSESVVVKPLHPFLRPLGVYAGMTILGDGGVAMILSSEGVARHSGVMHRPVPEQPAAEAAPAGGAAQAVLLFRYGPSELFAVPLHEVRRVVMVSREQVQLVGDRELVDVHGEAVNVLRLDHFLNVSACAAAERLFLVLPRYAEVPVALLASEILDAPAVPAAPDARAYAADGVAGSALVRGRMTLFLDTVRLAQMWQEVHGRPRALPPGAGGKRVLVVDDTRFFQRLIASCLEGRGYRVEVAADGAEAQRRLEGGAFDLVVSDLEMPVVNGFDFARRVRADPRFADLPMLALTTLTGADSRARAAASGFDGYEVKLDRASFLESVARLLERGRPAPALSGGPRG